jgi:predicted nucleic acid-binding protein
VRLFLDASVVLAACGRPAGGSHAIFDLAGAQGWRLLTGDYVRREVERNLRDRLSAAARREWQLLRPKLAVVTDELTHPWPVVFPAAKDRPVLFTAAAVADVLLTLDHADFGGVMAAGFYGLPVMKPGDFLRRERAAGRLTP